MTVVFQDGEPVDPKKLEDLQKQIDEIKDQSAKSYALSTTTANSVTKLSVMHLAAGLVEFPTLKKGLQSRTLENYGWGDEYETAFTVATPRLGNPEKFLIRWSLTGDKNSTTLYVYSAEDKSDKTIFHWVSAGKKNLAG
jgi:hypothetical protein